MLAGGLRRKMLNKRETTAVDSAKAAMATKEAAELPKCRYQEQRHPNRGRRREPSGDRLTENDA